MGALWRKVICSKYNLDSLSWFPSSKPNRLWSGVWRDITLVGKRDENLLGVYLTNTKIQLGEGTKVRFWLDVWVGEATLQREFPRIFRLCSQKSVVVVEVLQGHEASVAVNLELRRNVLSWEQVEWTALNDLLRQVELDPLRENSLSWEADPAGIFLVNSLYKCREARLGDARNEFNLIWKNCAPSKVQSLGWLALWGRVKTAELLFSLGILPEFNDCLCKFCGEVPESVDHFFVHCKMVWMVWCKVLSWWDIKWVVPASIKSLFIWWQGWKFKKVKKTLWDLFSFAVLWSIWKVRNDLTFQGVAPIWEAVGDKIKYRVATWINASHGPKDFSCNDIIFRLPSLIHSFR